MSLYAERAYQGPDMFGRTFVADHCQHCARRDEFFREQRLEKARRDALRAHGRALRFEAPLVVRLTLV